ncbi:beta-glucosidase 11-like isoform X2 [Diospyros lotus]|uniref:beta-glucosidase 11-like isoform X2 n=1 Tax=Diospyros lotus TaxID=55363 RepID=UPI00225293B5|nr:beta-glucosidase 11-like isoform X2 [Diospyros lotus]
MANLRLPMLFLLLLSFEKLVLSVDAEKYSRRDFPPDFVFGSGTSAYQYEGAAFEDGRTPSIWDTATHSGNIYRGNGDIACDGYHKYKEDIQLMAETGLEAYRFSISWSRLIPNGRGPVNPKGLEYYNNVINELLKHGGYDWGAIPPQRCSRPFGIWNCSRGDSSLEPYIAGHNILLAHASAVRLYKKKYQGVQHGSIGINIYTFHFVPFTNATEDVIAAERAKRFFIGWIVDPLVFGDYPEIVKKHAGTRIPAFTEHEREQVKGSFDFIGLNHYMTSYVTDKSSSLERNSSDFFADMAVQMMVGDVHGDTPPGEYPFEPSGLAGILEYFKQFYGNPPIHIHENGQRTQRNTTLNDTGRVKYLHGYIGSVLDALRNGSNTKGYFQWSFLDVFELVDGYESAYGLYYVDLDDKDLKRYPKLSSHWYSNFLKGKTISLDFTLNIEKSTYHFSQ